MPILHSQCKYFNGSLEQTGRLVWGEVAGGFKVGLNRPLRHTKLEQLSGKHLTPLISTYFQEACAEWNKHPEDSQDYGFGYGVIDKLQDVINGTLKGIHYQALICRFGEDSVHLFKLLLEFLEPDFRYWMKFLCKFNNFQYCQN